MTIHYFFEELWEEEYVLPKLTGHTVQFHQGVVQNYPELSDPQAEVLSIFINSKVDASVMQRFPNLKLVATRSTGFDHIDLDYCRANNINVCNVPRYGEQTVAEYAFALMLTISRRVAQGVSRLQNDKAFNQESLRGFDLENKTLGVIGTGKIGQHAIKIAKGFGMNVIAFDVYPNQAFADQMDFPYKTLDEVLEQSDVLTLHAPYNKSTHHMINTENISKIKKGAVLVNTARGGLVEPKALLSALDSGILASAGIDVWEDEHTLFQDEVAQKLINHPKMVPTPHNAFNTIEALHRILDTTADNIQKNSQGEKGFTVL